MKCEDRSRILNAIATGQSWLGELTGGRVASIEAIAMREDCSDRSVQRALSLAFLSPRIIEAIIDGTLPRGIGIASLASLPACFAKQHAGLGI
jgi:site-specific DNA recombinase